MKNALAETGVNSFSFMPYYNENADMAFSRIKHEIYSFIESEIPVLLCLEDEKTMEGHVVVVVGHGLNQNINVKTSNNACNIVQLDIDKHQSTHRVLSDVVNIYYAHDDSYGPFNRIKLIEGKCENPKKDKEPVVTVARGKEGLTHYLKQVLVPVPDIVRCNSTRVLQNLIQYFEERPYGKNFPKKNFIVWRSLFVEGAFFKKSVSKRSFSETLQKKYASLHLPKYVWLYEANCVSEGDSENWDPTSDDRRIIGEFLYDATCSNFDIRLLSERFLKFYRDYRDKPEDYITIKDFEYYEIYSDPQI